MDGKPIPTHQTYPVGCHGSSNETHPGADASRKATGDAPLSDSEDDTQCRAQVGVRSGETKAGCNAVEPTGRVEPT